MTKKGVGLWLSLPALLHGLVSGLDPFDVTFAFDGEEPARVTTLILAATNGPTYGGGFFICPDAVPDDGLFEVCMIDPLSLPEALVRLPFVIAGKHTKMKPIHMSRHTSVVIESADPVPAQIDGEVLLERRYEISMLPGAIICIVPKESA